MGAVEFVAAARRMLGTKCVHQGQRPGVGLDCRGLVISAAREGGADVRDVSGYPEYPQPRLLLTLLRAECRQVIGEPREGDIAAVSMSMGAKNPRHLLINVGETFIHASARGVREEPWTPSWRGRVHSWWRLPWQR